jgi:D-serine deaminase-like pyridoxal phosphate-dependent protein
MAEPGSQIEELPTPVLLLDLDALEHNVATMRNTLGGAAALRPHAKTHKCGQIAERQVAAGALGVTCATAREARALAEHPIPEILIANEVVTPQGVEDLIACAARTRMLVAVDNAGNVAQLAAAASAAGVEIGALVDVDIGMGRCGVRNDAEARAVAEAVLAAPGLALRGVTGFEGHVVLTREGAERARRAGAAVDRLAAAAESLRDSGIAVEIVSAGGTNTFATTAAHPAVTEIQAGTYVVMDTSYAPFAPGFRQALTVLATVVSRHGARAVLNCGGKTMGSTDLAPPGVGEGIRVVQVDEEHTLLDLSDADAPTPRIGERVAIAPSYCGATINLHDAYVVVREQRVVDVWPILARGPGRTPAREQAS